MASFIAKQVVGKKLDSVKGRQHFVGVTVVWFIVIYLARSANLPEWLYILLALISFFSFFYYEQSYLSTYWTDFHDLFTKWKIFA